MPVHTARRPRTVEVVDRLEQGRNRMPEDAELLLPSQQQLLDVLARRSAGEDPVLDGLELGLDGIEQREVAIHDRVDEGVEHVAGPELQELRFPLAARANVLRNPSRRGSGW